MKTKWYGKETITRSKHDKACPGELLDQRKIIAVQQDKLMEQAAEISHRYFYRASVNAELLRCESPAFGAFFLVLGRCRVTSGWEYDDWKTADAKKLKSRDSDK